MVEDYRPSKNEYYWSIAKEVASRGTCLNVLGGAVIVKDDQIIATGYIGAPRGTMDCFQRGVCMRRQLGIPSGQRYEICRSVHAEQNALINAARAGVSVLGSTIYLYFVKRQPDGGVKFVNAQPCFMCKKMLINSGVKTFVGNKEDGELASFDVGTWASEWKERDMLDHKYVYDSKYTKEEIDALKKFEK
ncbi:MAG: dCMP deaminase family protein [archaeon]|jgi:dCMP deaminase